MNARLFTVLFFFVTFNSYSIRLNVNTKCIKLTAIFINVCFNSMVWGLMRFVRSISRIFSLWISQNITKWMCATFHCFVVPCDVEFLFNLIEKQYKIYENYCNICYDLFQLYDQAFSECFAMSFAPIQSLIFSKSNKISARAVSVSLLFYLTFVCNSNEIKY